MKRILQNSGRRRRRSSRSVAATAGVVTVAVLLFNGGACGASAAAFAVPPPVVDFALGAVSGAAGTTAAYPFDYIKSQLQSDPSGERYRGGGDCLVKTVKEEGGVAQLYRGCIPYVVGLTPEKAIKLSVNDWTLAAVAAYLAASGAGEGGAIGQGTVPLWGQILAGSAAGLCQFTITTPLELVKLGMQTTGADPFDVIRNAGGIRGLYRGADATIARDVAFTAVLFPLKVALITSLCNALNRGDSSLACEFVAASLAAFVASIVATPADVVKTRMQAERLAAGTAADVAVQMGVGLAHAETSKGLAMAVSMGKGRTADVALPVGGSSGVTAAATVSTPFKERGMMEVGADILSREGPEVLFTGVVQRCIGSVPRFGVTLTMFDYLKHYAASHGYL